MSVVSRYREIAEAFNQDTLRLLHQRYAPAIVTVLNEVFAEDGRRTVGESDFHEEIDALLDLIAGQPDVEVPQQRGRALAYTWVEGSARGWLRYKDGDNPGDGNSYEITSEALDAIRYVQERGRHAMVSESRVKSLISKVADLALAVSEDRERRISVLNSRIDQLVAERDLLEAGGELDIAGEGTVLEGLDQIITEANGLPSDIRKVAERFAEMRERLRQEFRDDDLTAGQVLDLYQQRMDALLETDEQGRAFVGAVELMQRTATMRAFAADMDVLLAHDAAHALSAEERRQLKRMSRELSREVQTVLASHQNMAQTIATFIGSVDRVQAAELRSLLRELDRRLPARKAKAKVRTRVEVEFIPATIELARLRTRLADPADFAPPPELRRHVAAPMTAAEQRELLRMGAADVDRMRGILITRLKAAPRSSVADVFNSLPRDDRRLVDLFALFEASSATGAVRRAETTGHTDRYLTVHPLGIEERVFVAPRLTYSDSDRAQLISAMERART